MNKEMMTLNNGGMQIFENSEFGKIRITLVAGEPWFVAKDVCEALGLEQVTRTMSRIDEDERGLIQVTHPQNPEKSIKVNGVNEYGLYSLIISSKKPEAKIFKRWMTHEVIPAIRKHGAYMTPETMRNIRQSPQFIYTLMQDLETEQEKTKLLEEKIEQDKPLVNFANIVGNTSKLITMSQMAKILCDKCFLIGRNRLFERLRDKKILMQSNEPYQKYVDAGYFVVRDIIKGGKVFPQTLITGKGQQFIADCFKDEIDEARRQNLCEKEQISTENV